MVKFLQKITCAFAFSGGLVMGEQNGGLEVDETALLQTLQRHVPGDMAALEILLADAENDALIAHQELLGAFVPLAKVEAGTITTMDTLKSTVKDQFVTHTFVRPFAAVPVVVGVLSSAGHHPAEVRIFDVTTEQFKVTVVEPEGHTDGPHISERVDFLAVVPGVHDLYGLRVEAGLTSTNATVTNSKAFGSRKRSMWETLGWNFASTPALFASLNSINNDNDCFEKGKHIGSPWMTAATSKVSKKGAKISIERSEVADKSIVAEEEDIAWIAVQQGTPTGAEVSFTKKMGKGKRLGFEDAQKGKKAWLTTKEANPICVISKSSRYGNNGGWSRIFERKKNKVCVVIDEDMTKNKERVHVREDISMIAFPKAFSTCLQPGCCTSVLDCRVKMALAARKAVIFANREKWIVSVKTRILNLEKSLLEQAANSAARKEAEVKRKAAREQARLDNLAAVALLKLRKAECATAFPGKKKIGQLPADMSSLLETFEGVLTFTDCRLKCCIPAESSPSVACASVIFDANAATCFTMSDAYVNPLKGVAGPPVFAAAYEHTR